MLVFLQCNLPPYQICSRAIRKSGKKGSKIKFNYLPVGFKVALAPKAPRYTCCRWFGATMLCVVSMPDEQKINCNHEEYYVVYTAKGERKRKLFFLSVRVYYSHSSFA